jgi:SNF2 family DNA or RNA helicase
MAGVLADDMGLGKTIQMIAFLTVRLFAFIFDGTGLSTPHPKLHF